MHTKLASATSTVIENLVNATLSASASAREKHLFRQSLLGLVRLAKAEYRSDMLASMDKIIHTIPPLGATLLA